MPTMNDKAWRICDDMESHVGPMRIHVSNVGGARVIDCGGAVTGSLWAGLSMAKACMAGLAEITLAQGEFGPSVQVATDEPVRACLGSQYAGWQIQVDRFFAMGSGPIRALAQREELLKHLNIHESCKHAVVVMESRKHPTEEIVAYLASKLPEETEKITILVAPASSIAGTIQIVARSVETALHKLHELKFDVHKVLSGFGTAPLPPVAANEIDAIGRTNDAILYGSRVTLWVRADDEEIEAIGSKLPSKSSADYGSLFAELYARYGNFYQIDPLLFSPAEVTFVNLKTGNARTFGGVNPALLRKSFFGE